jgi:predicted GNAT family acetyltransferase
MDEIKLNLSENGRGAFFIETNGKQLAEMAIGISGGNLTVYHTEVSEELKGKGIASQLLATMVGYARTHALKVIPLCPYVLAQFKRHPEQYDDIWNRTWHS